MRVLGHSKNGHLTGIAANAVSVTSNLAFELSLSDLRLSQSPTPAMHITPVTRSKVVVNRFRFGFFSYPLRVLD